jgi:8-oxo-dGTP pyrophosphatase MutT (NUDIX family)
MAQDIMAGLSSPMTAARLQLYAATALPVFEQGRNAGYLQHVTNLATVTKVGAAVDAGSAIWHTSGDNRVCSPCDDRDGEEWPADQIPFWPGDGTFGEQCDGGVNCRCYLEYVEPDVQAEAPTANLPMSSSVTPAAAEALDMGASTIVQQSDGYYVYDGNGSRVAGPYPTQAAAQAAVARPGEGGLAAPGIAKAAMTQADEAAYAADQAAKNITLTGPISTGIVPYDTGQRISSPANLPKAATAAGLAVRAEDTGRVLMLQRAMTPGDEAGGTWEFPGGKLEDGESAQDGAEREWSEEVGLALPTGEVVASWFSGIYAGFVYEIGSEDDLDLANRDASADPDGDYFEAIAWWTPDHLAGNPGLRPELADSLAQVLPALT